MGFTDEQQKIIDLRNSSILVSAAAGSGKTTVLVERIIKRILDEENPVDIDEFLVVTFTKAAAAQMKEKIAARIEKELDANPESEKLIRQLHLVNRADITTIDSFCLKLVKENFGMLNLDSSFTIADTGFVRLMQNDALDKLFEKKFALDKDSDERKNFELLLDIFGSVRNDDSLREMILAVYNAASSFPEQKKWLKNAKETYECKDINAFDELPLVKKVIAETKSVVCDLKERAEALMDTCECVDGPMHYHAAISEDVKMFSNVLTAKGYEGMRNAMSKKFATLGRAKKDAMFDRELAEAVKASRDAYKKSFASLNIFSKIAEELLAENEQLKSYLVPLIELTEQFMEIFDELKNACRQLTFSDVAHFAYKLLCAGYDEQGRAIPTKVGEDISRHYKEIYIDEYQDSNFLQEDILTAVSGYHRNEANMFMVGDVKQSIYRFRLARPDIFMKKYKSFKDDGNEIKIDLKDNFRSRTNVLSYVNYIFYQLMGEDLGGITYAEDIALSAGKSYKLPADEIKERIGGSVELHVIDSRNDEAESTLSDDEQNMDKASLEAMVIAERIKSITDKENGMYVFDEKTDTYRVAKYSDIVILLRNMKNYGETIKEVLNRKNIPVYLEEANGYFNAVEIRTIMSLLSVIDNSRDDISLAAVLLSPIGCLNENELARISLYAIENNIKGDILVDKCRCYQLDMEDEISGKLERFFEILDSLKELKKNASIAELINTALEMTGYYEYALAMPMGKRRKANIDMLLEKAKSFEDGYYKGLFNFLRYIDKLRLADIDFGEANVLSENENVVRITTMHKSKGLEYPIVFVSGLGKWFNEQDLKDNVIIHGDYYLAGKLMNISGRYKSDSFMREAVKRLIKSETIGEELRVLYVALTRAKEKLILTGVENGLNDELQKIAPIKNHADRLLPFSVRRDTKSFLRLILSAMERLDKLDCDFYFEMKTYKREDVVLAVDRDEIKKALDITYIKQSAIDKEKDGFYESYKESFLSEYAYKAIVDIKSKMSISEIKRMKAFDGNGFDIDEEGNAIIGNVKALPNEDAILDEKAYTEESTSEKTPGKKKEQSTLSGTDYGTLVHKVMELVGFSECLYSENGMEYIKDFLNRLVSDNIISASEKEILNPKKIYEMISSPLGVKMAAAEKRGELFKEQQFSAGIPVGEIYSADDSIKELSDVVVVQGIIDAFFYEDDEIVVMDYKTDRAAPNELVGRYKAQLDYYAATLEGLTGKKVREKVLYSFYLGKEVVID